MPPRPAPRVQPTYDPGAHMQSNRGNFGIYILKDGVQATLKKPSWNRTETVFRPYPSLSYDDPNQFLPYRLDPAGRNVFGHWIRRYDCAWGVGNPGTTFLLNDPGAGDSTYDPWMTPLGILYRAIEGACKKGQGRPEWYPLREGSSGRGKALRAPSEMFLMQGVLMRYESKNLFGGNKVAPGWGKNPPCILMLSSGVGRELIRQLCIENEGYQGDPADFERRYLHGDPVSPLHGRYLHFFQKGSDPRQRYQANPTARSGQSRQSLDDVMSDMDRTGGATSGGGQEDIGFDLFISRDLDGLPASFTDRGVEIAKSKWLYWEEVLWFPTEVEQAHLLFKIFPISACLYAFDGVNPDWIPEDARKRAASAVSVVMPGMGMPGQVHPTPMPAAPHGFGQPQYLHAQQHLSARGETAAASPSGTPATQATSDCQVMPASCAPVPSQPVGGMDDMFSTAATDESVPPGQIDDNPVQDGGFGYDASPAAPAPAAPSDQQQQRTQTTIAQLAAARAAATRSNASNKK